jgi:hypothetical protein
MKASSRMAHPKPDGCGDRIHDRSGHRAVLRARARAGADSATRQGFCWKVRPPSQLPCDGTGNSSRAS